jgi:hypothetical protein
MMPLSLDVRQPPLTSTPTVSDRPRPRARAGVHAARAHSLYPLGSLAKAWASSFPAGRCCTLPRMHACTHARSSAFGLRGPKCTHWGGVGGLQAGNVRAHATVRGGGAPHACTRQPGVALPLHAVLKQTYQAVRVSGKEASQQASGAWWDGDRGDARPPPPPTHTLPPSPPPFPAGLRGSSTPPFEPLRAGWPAG